MSRRLIAQSQSTSTNLHHLTIALPASVPSLAPANVPLLFSIMATVSDDTPHSYAGVPKLTKLNYPDWAMQMEAYLTGAADHWRVIEGAEKADGPPTDKTSTDCIACGVIMATARELHAELILQNKGKPYDMWKAIEAQHLQQDASLRHDAWMQLLALRKKVDETYIDFFRRVEGAYARVHHITPKDQTSEQRGQELTLFTVLSGLPHDDSLRRSLTAQRSLTLNDTFSAFLPHAESANAASGGSRCFLCNSPEHLARDCHHREAINQLVARQNGNNTGNNGRGNGNGSSAQANATLASGANNANNVSNTGTAVNGTSTANANGTLTQETAGVASLFFTSSSHLADAWLCD
jgi:hypothetical protein